MNALFENRAAAGMALARRLEKYSGSRTVVFGMSNGGALVAAELAHGLSASLDLLLVRTLDLPCAKKTVFGAVAPEGTCVLDDEIVDLLDVESDAIGSLRCQADADLEELNRSLRGGRPLPNVLGRTVMLVDDIVASAIKVRAALLFLHRQEPGNVIVAAPAITTSARRDVAPLVSALVAVEEEWSFYDREVWATFAPGTPVPTTLRFLLDYLSGRFERQKVRPWMRASLTELSRFIAGDPPAKATS